MNYQALDEALDILNIDNLSVSYMIESIQSELNAITESNKVFDDILVSEASFDFKEVIQKIIDSIKKFFSWLFGKFTAFWKAIFRKIDAIHEKIISKLKKQKVSNEAVGYSSYNLVDFEVMVPNMRIVDYVLSNKIYAVEYGGSLATNLVIFNNSIGKDGEYFMFQKSNADDLLKSYKQMKVRLTKAIDKIKDRKHFFEKVVKDLESNKENWSQHDALNIVEYRAELDAAEKTIVVLSNLAAVLEQEHIRIDENLQFIV